MGKAETTTSKLEAINIAKRYKELLARHLEFSELVLFGSYSNDLARPDSDIDIAVVVEYSDPNYFAQVPLLWKLRREIDLRIEPILIDKSDDKLAFLDEVKKHGIVIK